LGAVFFFALLAKYNKDKSMREVKDMAVVAIPVQSSLRLVVQTGTDTNGDPVFSSRTYNRIKPQAPDADLFDVASALAGLQTHALYAVQRVATNELAEE